MANNPLHVSEEFRKDGFRMIENVGDFSKNLSYKVDILDYTSPGLKNGVGEARKIGMSYAISKYLHDPKDRIVSLDADCTVSLNYVWSLFNKELRGQAFTFYFEHSLQSRPLILYETYLRYLRWGHLFARSPFSHYSVGSCFGTTVEAYQKAGGMIAKSATEDFHFLNKIRKLGAVDYWSDAEVFPSGRVSQRVTLGTGYFLTSTKEGLERAFQKLMVPAYSDFEKLRAVLQSFSQYDGSSLEAKFRENDLTKLYLDLRSRGMFEKIHKIFETTSSTTVFRFRLNEVVDGLETLRMLRFLSKDRRISVDQFWGEAQSLWNSELDWERLLIFVRDREKSGVLS